MSSIADMVKAVAQEESQRSGAERAACEAHAQAVCDAYGWKPTPFVWAKRTERSGDEVSAFFFSVPVSEAFPTDRSLNFACFSSVRAPVLVVEADCPDCGRFVYSEEILAPHSALGPNELPSAAYVLQKVLTKPVASWAKDMPSYLLGGPVGRHETTCPKNVL